MTISAPDGYQPLFEPSAAVQPFDPERAYRLGDRSEAAALPYVYQPAITLAVNVALTAGRPLLVRGTPGTGKSSLARSVAEHLGWRFYPVTVSSRTSARDLLWTFDTVARLADAQEQRLSPRAAYLTPGVLWWAFDRASARWRGLDPGGVEAQARGFSPAIDPTPVNRSAERSVVLIDEIDKADPDVPNDLLVPLGSYQFSGEAGHPVVAATAPLVIITTNEERELPRAFLRRCAILALEQPDDVRLLQIARAHFPDVGDDLLGAVSGAYRQIRADRIAGAEPPPSVAEFLDALAACRSLRTGPSAAVWEQLSALLLAKPVAIPDEVR
jgi:MoxR-like ATPase